MQRANRTVLHQIEKDIERLFPTTNPSINNQSPPSADRSSGDIARLRMPELATIERKLRYISERFSEQKDEIATLTARLQSIFHATKDAIVLIRAPNELFAVNDAAYRLFEVAKGSVTTAEAFFFKAPLSPYSY